MPSRGARSQDLGRHPLIHYKKFSYQYLINKLHFLHIGFHDFSPLFTHACNEQQC
jgi:hypothetical protein